MIPVKDMMIGENRNFEIMVCKASMQIQEQRDEMDFRVNL